MTIDGKTSTVRTKYIPGGATQALTYPDGATAAWTYTPLGAVSTIQTSNPALGTTVYSAHTPTSQAQHVAYGNGATADLTYDASGIPQTRVLRDARGNAVLAEAYVRDGLFRVVQAFDCLATANAANALCAPTGVRATNTTDLTRSFTYSDRRLKSATLGRTNYNLGYDAAGNLYQINGNTLPVSGQQLACNGSHAPSSCYDANGSLLSAADRQASRTYGYDAANRLRSASKGGTRLATFGYDHLGERRTKTTYAADGVTVAGTTTWPSTHYSTWAGPAGAHPQHTVYVPGPTGPVASFTVADTTRGAPTRTTGPTPERATASSGAVAFYAQDDTLSTRVVTDGSGQLVARVDYGPYGDVAAISPPGANPGPNLFGGHVFDFETGLYQYGARYYDPRVGRFITPDDRMGGPLERQDAFHRYAFALNDPTTYVDLSGHRGCMALGVALGGVTGAFAFIGTILGAKDETARDKAAVAFTSIGALLGTAVTVGGGSWAVCTYYRDRVARQAREAREDAEDRAHRRADADDPDDTDPIDDNPLQTLGGDGEVIEAELMNTVASEAPVALRTATPEAEVMSVVEPKPTEATGLQTSAVEAEDEVVEEVFEDLALDALVDL